MPFSVKVLTYAVWIGSGLLFWQVGSAMDWPADPHATLSLVDLGASGWMLPVLVVLAALTSAVATLVLRRWLRDAGLMAAAIGLAALSTRGGTVESLLLRGADGRGPGPRTLSVFFAAELLVWCAVLLVAAVVTARFTGKNRDRASSSESPALPRLEPASHDLAALRRLTLGADAATTPLRAALAHAGMAAAITMALRIVFCVDVIARPISHGQALFVSAASSFIAACFAFRRFPVRSALWAIAASLGVSFVGYLLAVLGGGQTGLPPNIPGSPFLRMLPVQTAAAGVGGALWGLWFIFDPMLLAHASAPSNDDASNRTPRSSSRTIARRS